MKAAFGEYSAFTNKDSVRYQKNNKLVKGSSLPDEVVTYLNKQLNFTPKEVKPERTFARPSDEELAIMRAKSRAEVEAPEEDPVIEPMGKNDFEPDGPEDFPPNLGFVDTRSEAEKDFHAEADPMSDFMESVSIHTASIQDMVQALHERFGIYTVYLGELPNSDEINPLTGEIFTKYHLGIAYQAAIYAKNKGILSLNPELNRKHIDEGRDAHENFKMDTPAYTRGEARQQNSFEHRTSVEGNHDVATSEIVHVTDENGVLQAVRRDIPAGQTGEFNGAQARFDKEEDELILQPQMGRQVIRPNW